MSEEEEESNWMLAFIPIVLLVIALFIWFATDSKFGVIASCYDRFTRRSNHKKMDQWRETLVPRATGNVLDLGAGTGANLAFFQINQDVKAITLLDISKRMLDVARAKIPLHPQVGQPSVVVGRAESMSMFEDNTFDTVISIDNMCSFSNPAAALVEVHRVLKPGGQALLAEHGRTHSCMRNALLSCASCFTVPLMGVHYGRDIEGLIARSPLKVLEHKRASNSTFHEYVLCKQGMSAESYV